MTARNTDSRGGVLALPSALGALLIAAGVPLRQMSSVLGASFLGAGGALVLWAAILYLITRRTGRRLVLETAARKQHWVQACAQVAVFLYWGWHAPIVPAFVPLILAQIAFAYGVDALLAWSRRDTHALGFGPIPIVLSINLFLWFRPDWFYWQFAMIPVGYLAKEFIRWERDGRSAHIFNPSSFPLAVFSLALILTGSTDITLGRAIANTQSDPSLMYLVIFLTALPGQLLFGVASMTLAAVVTVYGISLGYVAATGTFLFFDSYIPVPVFLGMHLLFTDPSTAPRSELGRILFGVIYGVGSSVLFVVLSHSGIPTFYDKLLPVPLMNLLVRGIDRLVKSRPLTILDPARLGGSLTQARRNVAYTGLWTLIFVGMSAVQGVGDRHPGQYRPFWQRACEAGGDRACSYLSYLTLSYCNNGSGWACNEWGIQEVEAGRPAGDAFERACGLGFTPACENARRPPDQRGPWARGAPALADLPIVLRGTKPVLAERSPERLYALACAQGWPGACDTPPSM
jgi:hypothetical protein